MRKLARQKWRVALLCPAAALLSLMATCLPAGAQITDVPAPGQARVNIGALGTFIPEQYLTDASNSAAATETLSGGYDGGHWTYKREAADGGYFAYRVPVAPDAEGPLYLAAQLKGDAAIAADGAALFSAPAGGLGSYTSLELALSDPALWSDGFVDIRFEDAHPGNAAGFSAYWLELGETSPWRESIRRILWDTSGIVWNVGYYDGYSTEFRGEARDFAVGGDISALAGSGAITLRWDAAPAAGREYWLLAGVIGGSGLTSSFDVGDDGVVDFERVGSRERNFDLNVTDLLREGENSVKIALASGARLDFAALVEVEPGFIGDGDLRVSFKGGQMARDWTKLVNTTMFFNDDLFVDKASGYIDASPPNGIFRGGYWMADAAPMTLELARWGFFDLAKIATAYKAPTEYFNTDNGASGLMLASIAYLMKSDNYEGEYVDRMYPGLKYGLDYYVSAMDAGYAASGGKFSMIRGNNGETTSGNYGAYNNSIACFALYAGAEAAARLGYAGDAAKWADYAEKLKESMEDQLIAKEETAFIGNTLPKNTLKYAVTADGGPGGGVAAGWFGIGRQEELYSGYRGDASPKLREAMRETLLHHSSAFWNDWELYGHNQGFGTSYGVMSERGGWPLSAMFMSDMMDMAKKNLEHVVYNSSDYYFENGNEGVAELSPWAIVREISADDHGITGAQVGNGGAVEDMNLVEHAVTMSNVRYMVGLDDALPDGENLAIMPRVPRGWEGVKANEWPIVYRKGDGGFARTAVSFDYSVSPLGASMTAAAADRIDGVRMRFGPFEKTAEVAGVTVGGKAYGGYEAEDSGDSRWVWVTADIRPADGAGSGEESGEESGGNSAAVEVRMELPGLALYEKGEKRLEEAMWLAPAKTLGFGGGAQFGADLVLAEAGAAGLVFAADESGGGGFAYVLDKNDGAEGAIKLIDRASGAVLFRKEMNVALNRQYSLMAATKGSIVMLSLGGTRVGMAFGEELSDGRFGVASLSGEAAFDGILASASDAIDVPTAKALGIALNGMTGQAKIISSVPMSLETRVILSDGTTFATDMAASGVRYFSSDESVVAMDGARLAALSGGVAEIWAEAGDGSVASNRIAVSVEELFRGAEIFSDDFEGAGLANWSRSGAGTFSAQGGAMTSISTGDAWNINAAGAADFVYSGDVTLLAGTAVGLSFRTNDTGSQGYDVILDIADGGIKLNYRPYTVIQRFTKPFVRNRAYNITVVAKGPNIRVFWDGVEVIDANDSRYPSGKFGVFGYMSEASYDNIAAHAAGALAEIELASTQARLFVPLGAELSVTGRTADGTAIRLSPKDVEFGLSPAGFLELDADSGAIAAVAEGVTEVTAALKGGGGLKSNALQIQTYLLSNLALAAEKPVGMVGEPGALALSSETQGGALQLPLDGALKLEFHSSNRDVAEIADGKIVRKSRGSAQLWATAQLGEATLESNRLEVIAYAPGDAATLLDEDFNDGGLDGWKAFNGIGDWTNSGGALQSYMAVNADAWCVYQGAEGGDFVYTGKVTLNSGTSVGLAFRVDDSGSAIRGYEAILDNFPSNRHLVLLARRATGYAYLQTYKLAIEEGREYELTIIAEGREIKVLLDGAERISYTESGEYYASGKFGAFNHGGSDTYDDLFAYAPPVIAESVSVAGAGGAAEISSAGGTLQMQAAVLPEGATDKSVTWTIERGGDCAQISDTGLLTALSDGEVTVRATANSPSGAYGEAAITVANQGSGQPGAYFELMEKSGGGGSAYVAKVSNGGGEAIEGTICFAIYGKDGRLASLAACRFSAAAGGQAEAEFSAIGYPQGEYAYKAFCWDGAIAPLFEAATAPK
jgi:hypothetical protein